MSYSVINWTVNKTESRSDLGSAIRAVTKPTGFVGPNDEWEIVKLPQDAGSAGALISSQREGRPGPVSSTAGEELLARFDL